MQWTLLRAVENTSVQLQAQGQTGGGQAVMSRAASRVTLIVVLIEEGGKRAFHSGYNCSKYLLLPDERHRFRTLRDTCLIVK